VTRAALSGPRALFATAARTAPLDLYASLALALIAALGLPLFPLLFKVLVDAAAGESSGSVVPAAVALAAVSTGAVAARTFAAMFAWNLWERMTIVIDEQLVASAAKLGLVDRLERPEYIERLTLLRTHRETFQQSMMSVLWSAVLAVQVLVTIALLITVAPLLLLLPLFSVAPIAASRWAEAHTQRALRESAPDTRAADAFGLLAVDPTAAGELRVLRLRELVLSRHAAAWERAITRQWRAEWIGAVVSAGGLMLFTAGFGGALMLVTGQALDGSATVGSVILVLTAGQQLHNQIGGVLSNSGDLFRIVETLRQFAWLDDYLERHRERGAVLPAPALADGIALEDVSFRYDGADRDALQHVSLTLPRGGVVAVVGENGAGKSTLVKLLCGLHRPSAGRILVDGRDLSELDADAWRGSLSAAFQEFVRFELIARESVGVGRVDAIDRADDVHGALVRADVADLEDELPEGLESALGRAFLDGIDLSGGQWQKVALARAMMPDAPLVLALDEPTYSLDVESERRVFEWFSRVAHTENPAGTITVIVSHRFSTVRTADLVAVLHDGAVVETGTHAELLARDGRYAAMYRTQAAGYR
jgi:ATP-binding cassette, subfamily B, bacterial